MTGEMPVLRLFTPLEIMPRSSAAGLDFRMIPAGFIPFRDKSLTGFNAPLEFLTGFTQVLSKRYAILGLQYAV